MELVLSLGLFFLGAFITGLVYRAQKHQGNESEHKIINVVLKEEGTTRTSLKILCERMSRVVEKMAIPEETKHQIIQVLSEAEFFEIIEGIDPQRQLIGGSAHEAKELTKRLFFYVIKEIFYFPYTHYRQFVDWLNDNGYSIPQHLAFDSEENYQKALIKVEKLNRTRIPAELVDVDQLFSYKRPFVSDK